jgi:thiamine-phosphate pyrophosphorylase
MSASIRPPLPSLLVLTDRRLTGGRPLLDVARAVVDGGGEAIVLREKDLPFDERRRVADALRAIVPILVIASDADPLVTDAADAVHLSARARWPTAACGRPELHVGRSAHGADELASAARAGASYATLSPIRLTDTKPGYGPALGVDALRDAPLPVYALGGLSVEHVGAAIAAGACGVAVLGAIMRAERPDRVVAALVAVLADAAATGVVSTRATGDLEPVTTVDCWPR